MIFTRPGGGGPPEVRYAHPVRLPPAPHSRGHVVAFVSVSAVTY